MSISRTRGLRSSPHGHRFLDAKGLLVAPDRLRLPLEDRRPGETAFALARRADDTWRYLGVAHRSDDDATWAVPEVDFATWRAWGEGREASRRQPEGALVRARQLATAILALREGAFFVIKGEY